MSGSVYAIAAMVIASGVAGARADEPTAAAAQSSKPEARAESTARPTAPTSMNAPDAPQKIVIHANTAHVQAGDARVQVGGMKISMSPWASGTAEGAKGNEPVPAATTPDSGAITVPSNTLGPGEPHWRIQERADYEHRLAEARIERAEADAEHATRQAGRDRGYIFFGNSYLRDGWSGRGYGSGLRGPVTTTTTYSDQLGSTAQRAFSDAAYPRLNGTTEARDAIVSQFGRDATPPIVRIQNGVDAIHRQANSEATK